MSYVLLSEDFSRVVTGQFDIDPAVVAAWTESNNPKQARYRTVNMIAQPAINPLTQQIAQTGWTITDIDAQPVWTIQVLTAAQQTAVAAANNYAEVMAGNVVQACTNAINNWGALNATQKDTVLLTLVKVLRALLQNKFGVNN